MLNTNWIALELHDGLMQWVIGARMHVASMLAAMKENQSIDDLEGKLSQIDVYLRQASEEGRQLIRFIEAVTGGQTERGGSIDSASVHEHSHESGAIDVPTVIASTVELMARKTHNGLPVIEYVPPNMAWPAMSAQRSWPIVRIVQQAAINAMRHSQASRVVVELATEVTADGSHAWIASVTDDGTGFDPSADFPGHFGLKSMRQRARENRLQLSIESSTAPNKHGTRVVLRFADEC